MTAENKAALPGMGLALTIAAMAFMTSSLHKAFDPLVISIIFGMLVGNMFDDRSAIESGIRASIKYFLPIGIALYGTQLRLVGMDLRFWPAAAGVFAMLFAVSYLISRGFGIGKTLAFLLSAGISVCGASAIAVVAPIVMAEKEDVSISLLSVMTLGLTGMLIYRFMPEATNISVERFAFLSGTTLPMFGQVIVAARPQGEECLMLASNYKLLRVSALLPVALLAFFFRRPAGGAGSAGAPWFMVFFFILAAASNISGVVASIGASVEPAVKFFLCAALSAIGLSLDFDSIASRGAGPLLSCFLSLSIVALTIYLIFSVTP